MNATVFLLAALTAGSGDSLRIAVAPSELLRVVEVGTGVPVVLIPGFSGTAFGYRHIVAGLVEHGWRAVVIEPLGIGGSSRPRRADYSLTAQADRIAAALDTLHIASAVVVAHSLAGSIALRLAHRHPDHVRSIISIEGGAAESATRPGFRRLLKLAPVLKLLAGPDVLRSVFVREMKAASADTSWIDDAVVAGYTADVAADFGAALAAYQAMSRAVEPSRLADCLSEIRIPVVLLLGASAHGSAPPASEIVLLEQRLPGLTIERVAGAGHYVHEERPDRVLAAIARFGDRPPGAPITAVPPSTAGS